MEMLDAKEAKEFEEVEKIEKWFNKFENSLISLFDQKDLKLVYDRKNFSYNIQYENRSFGLNELSDGYSSVLSIITELILRMEAHQANNYDLQGVVLIDEIETHLHVSLQKKILPFLTAFFPKIQFIITTHSPFVLSSLSNTVICDLERMETVEDLTAYSYESLVDSYFETDKYSTKVKENLKRYKILKVKDVQETLSDTETRELLRLENYFESLPKYQNEEVGFLFNRMQESVSMDEIQEINENIDF